MEHIPPSPRALTTDMAPKQKQKRQTFTEQQKKSLCDWTKTQQELNGVHPDWKETAKWFSDTHQGKAIAQSSMSTILAKCSADFFEQSLSAEPWRSDIKKRREVKYPELDKALYEWHIVMQKHVPISGMVLKEKAKDIFVQIYPGMSILFLCN